MDSHSSDFDIFKKQSLFHGFNDQEINSILKLCHKKVFENNESIIEENDTSRELYVIADGEVKLLKWDKDQLFQLPLGKLGPGQLFGDMSFLDGTPRSSTIEATKKTTVYVIYPEDVKKNLPESIYNKIISNIASINIGRLKSLNEAHVAIQRSTFRKLQFSQQAGMFIILIALIFGGLNLLFSLALDYLSPQGFSLSLWAYEFLFWYLALISTWILIKAFHFYLDEFGVNTENLSKTLPETLLAIVIGMTVIFIAYLISSSKMPITMPWQLWILGYLAFCLSFEFIARGVILSSIKNLLHDERGWASIIWAACFISFLPFTSYVRLEINTIIIYFLINLLMGWIYLHQRSLVGVITIHFLLGAFARYLQLI